MISLRLPYEDRLAAIRMARILNTNVSALLRDALATYLAAIEAEDVENGGTSKAQAETCAQA